MEAGLYATAVYKADVESTLADLGDRVWLAEDVPNSQVTALLRSSTVLIRGTQQESFGLSRIEALLAGIPVVATDTGQTDFMTLYTYGNERSLLAATSRASDAGPEALQAAAAHYGQVASQSFETILDVYAQLGLRPARR